ncbi:hypothetical protein [Vibrio furnissii]|uniref:hypothetical protein n=1 Tax=Vibrio furnissii TaxID=29494 RepID=UPI001303F255|nr:hypothetical protein [Vibrio furnissii]UHJ63090.1 hypothetical protein LUM42_18985 [Vibrio furnissii]
MFNMKIINDWVLAYFIDERMNDEHEKETGIRPETAKHKVRDKQASKTSTIDSDTNEKGASQWKRLTV